MTLRDLAEMAITIAATLTAMGIIFRLKPVRWLLSALFGHPVVRARASFRAEVADVVRPLAKKVDEIHHEVRFNNGSSLKDLTMANADAIARVESKADDSLRMASEAATESALAKEAAAEVKADLDAAHGRADAVPSHEPPGAAADAAATTNPQE